MSTPFRDLVTGTDVCTTADGVGTANPLGRLADAILNLGGTGSTNHAKGPTGLSHDVPAFVRRPTPPGRMNRGPVVGPSTTSSSVHPRQPDGPHHPASFESAWRDAPQQVRMMDVWRDIHPDLGPGMPPGGPPTAQVRPGPDLAGPLHGFLRGQPPGPAVGVATPSLAVEDQLRVRNRASILARQVFADGPEAQGRVRDLLRSLGVPTEGAGGVAGVRAGPVSWDRLWGAGPGGPGAAHHALGEEGSAWEEMAAHRRATVLGARNLGDGGMGRRWGDEFGASEAANRSPGASWASEFRSEIDARSPEGVAARVTGGEESDLRRSSAAVAAALSADPRMQQSQFLQFVSKMSRGELSIRDNTVVTPDGETLAMSTLDAAWADVAATAEHGRPAPGALDPNHPGAAWAASFAAQQRGDLRQVEMPFGVTDVEGWVEEFAAAMAQQDAPPGPGTGSWADEFETNHPTTQPAPTVNQHGYRFATRNPFRGDADALHKGTELFRRGVLSEAVLALEAAIQDTPSPTSASATPPSDNAWRLLGTVHAENDDDQQSIAAMRSALATNAENLEALMSLGVSFTNELDLKDAVGHLFRWLQSHPVHRAHAETLAPALTATNDQAMLSATISAFSAAAQSSNDADLWTALGVLRNLQRDFTGSAAAFRSALETRPSDYSLWNKLGATLANGGHSHEAITAYQRALDLKPNYLRTWVNLGIAHSNLGRFADAARIYLAVLDQNPGAEHIWSNLRNALVCEGRYDLIPAVAERQGDVIGAALGPGTLGLGSPRETKGAKMMHTSRDGWGKGMAPLLDPNPVTAMVDEFSKSLTT